VRCEHLVDGGRCGIYLTRPAECRAFRCAHLEGEDAPRPDKLGAILVQDGDAPRFLALSCGEGVFVRPAWEKVRARHIARGRVLVEATMEGRTVHGTRAALEKLAQSERAKA
jgi:hypothetical protein